MPTITLKYPIILVHGLAAKDKVLFWGRTPKRLMQAGLQVAMGNTDSWGCFENNARALAETVDKTLAQYGCEKVNLIAHSKGGLDSRFLISTLGYADKVASLNTIATPHRGAELADYLLEERLIYTIPVKKIISVLMKIYGDRSPEPYKIVEELSTKNMVEFNRHNPDHADVYYSSYLSLLKGPLNDMSYYYTYSYIEKIAGRNDGVVSLASARWGEDFTLIEGLKKVGISHSEIIDVKRTKISGIDIPDIYIKIAEKLAARGL